MRKAAILVDYENVAMSASANGKIVDLKEMIKLSLERVGIVKVALVFVPRYLATDENLKEFDAAGFDCISYPKQMVHEKEKDLVDSRMIALSKKLFDEHSDVTDIIIVSNDGDFTPLVTFFKHRGKHVVLFGLGDVSSILKKAVDITYEVPTK